MYKEIKIGKVALILHKFPRTAKNVSNVYKTGFRNWDSFECMNHSVVLGVWRIIVSKDHNHGEACE